MLLRLTTLAACLIASSPLTAASYSAEGALPAAGHVDHALYGFDVAPPSDTYRSFSWRRFSDNADARTTVLAIGMPGYDSYALSVMASEAGAGSAEEVARRRQPEVEFTAIGVRRECVVSDLGKPVRLDSGMVAFLAACVDSETRLAFELTMSWESQIIAIGESPRFRERAAQCAPGAFEPDGEEPCVDRLETMRDAMRTFVGSFRFASARS